MPRTSRNIGLAAYFPYSCLIEYIHSASIDASGDQIEVWDVFVTAEAALGENKGEEETYSRQEFVKFTHYILLNGEYQVEEGMRATIDSLVYDVIRVSHAKLPDGMGTFTSLKVNRVI